MELLTLNAELTLLCNNNCPYCYLKESVGQDCRMTAETMKLGLALVEKFGRLRPEGKIEPTTINFYGGEPMLAWPMIVKCVEEAERRGWQLKYGLVTNGTLATDEQVAFCKAHKIMPARSMDGCPEVMERTRPGNIEPYLDGSRKWNDFATVRRCTVPPWGAKYMLKTIHYLESLGYSAGACMVPDMLVPWTDEEIEEITTSLWLIGQEYVSHWKAGKRFGFHLFEREARRFQVASPKDLLQPQGCGSGRKMRALSWDGYLFPCSNFTTEPRDSQLCMGHARDVLTGTAKGFGPMVTEYVAFAGKGGRPERCKSCLAQIGCGGSCMHNNWKRNGTLLEPPDEHCRIHIVIAQVVAWIDSQLRMARSDWWKGPPNANPPKNPEKNSAMPKTSSPPPPASGACRNGGPAKKGCTPQVASTPRFRE